MTQATDVASLNGRTFTANYFYSATSDGAGSANNNGNVSYNGTVTPGAQAGISGTITDNGSGRFTLTSSSGSTAQYQVVGSTADGSNLIFESNTSIGSNTGPYFVLAGSGAAPTIDLDYSSTNNYTPPAPVCFAAGTRICTIRGNVVIEDIGIGDVVITASGNERPVVWTGNTLVHAARRSRPDEVNPIQFARHSLGDNVPSADLMVSPGHRMLIGGKLYQAASLVNGTSIKQVPVDSIRYFHIELDAPDALLAEGAAAESYIDVGNRTTFSDAIGHPSAPAIIDADPETETFAPTIKEGPELAAVRCQLIEQALRSGWTRIIDKSFLMEVNGQALHAAARVGDRAWFVLPEAANEVKLISKSAVCNDIKPDETDDRRLGIQVVGVIVDGRNVQMGHPAFAEGFHDCETTDDDEHFRWTNGSACLRLRKPASVIEIVIGRGAELIVPDSQAEVTLIRASA